MKKSIIIILAVVAILVIWAVSVYNGLVTMDENVTGQWANVETQYQRRADLIPNLVNTVKGYATHEKETLEGVVAARSQATQIKVDAEDLTPEKLAEYLKKLLDVKNEKSVLVVGLGNREVTPDALGPEVAGHLRVTRHVVREYGKTAFAKEKVHLVSAIVPGVMAQTGMETLEVVQGIVAETKPDYVVVIDALAARSSKRLNRTIQLSDAGIQPGSGVGNHRNSLSKETIGVPVLAIGVPTVVDAATIVYDATGDRRSVPPGLNGMFVTPKNVDEMIRRLSFTISEALNLALS